MRIDRFSAEPKTLTVGEEVRFRWALTPQSVQGLTCELDAGDGAPIYIGDCAVGERAYTYAAAGTYSATLTVNDGKVQVSRVEEGGIEVAEASAENPGDGGGEPPEPLELTWNTVTPQAVKVGEAQGEVVGGKLYVFGGFDSTKGCCTPTARAQVYDPAADAWTALEPMPAMNGTTHGGVTHAGMATDGKDIYFAGGYTSNRSGDGQIFGTSEVWKYDVSEDLYSRLPDLPQTPESGSRNRHSAGQMEFLNGKLHYFGGTSADRKSDVTHHFTLDLANDALAWAEVAPMPAPRNHLGSTVLGGKIYAIGGQTGHDGGLTTHSDIYAYDPAADNWAVMKPLPKPLSHISSSTFVLEGRILVVDGEVDHLEAVRDVFAYSPETDTWTSLTELPVALRSMVSGAVDGVVYVTGGSGNRKTYRGLQD